MKIAMWSGPRNLSTAMMYSFGNRGDLRPWDEPFYAAYLNVTKIKHPMQAEILAAGPTDPQIVADEITQRGDAQFLKLMTFHIRDGFSMDWGKDCKHFHLIRHPARVIASYSQKRESPTLEDIGFARHLEIYRQFPGPVVSSFDIRQNPRKMLKNCAIHLDLSLNLPCSAGLWVPKHLMAFGHLIGMMPSIVLPVSQPLKGHCPNLQGKMRNFARRPYLPIWPWQHIRSKR